MFCRQYLQADYQFENDIAAIFSLLVDAATETLIVAHGLNGIEIMSTAPFRLTVKVRCDTPLQLQEAGKCLDEVSHALNRVQLETAHAPLDLIGPVHSHEMQLNIYDADGNLQVPNS
jgi:hypothetical protein